MKGSIKSQILKGTMAASILLGGAALVYSQAFADASQNASAGAATQQNTQHNFRFGGHRGQWGGRGPGKLLQETATILNVDASSITSQLKQGKTLAQIAETKGMTEADYLQKLAAAETQNIKSAVTAGKLTQAQADKMTQNLSGRLKQAIEHTGLGGPGMFGGRHGRNPGGMFGGMQEAAKILGITPQQLKSDLQSGQSLADIAQSKGISEDQLIQDLKDAMTSKLKAFVEHKGTKGPQAPAGQTGSAGSQSVHS